MKVGDIYEIKQVVTPDVTAASLKSGALNVFGTPYLITMIEDAAFQYMGESLPAGKSSVGTAVNINHLSPTPVGMEVRVVVEVTDISSNGKFVVFKATAYDECGLIGEGSHQRAVVTVDRFMEKCQAKLLK